MQKDNAFKLFFSIINMNLSEILDRLSSLKSTLFKKKSPEVPNFLGLVALDEGKKPYVIQKKELKLPKEILEDYFFSFSTIIDFLNRFKINDTFPERYQVLERIEAGIRAVSNYKTKKLNDYLEGHLLTQLRPFIGFRRYDIGKPFECHPLLTQTELEVWCKKQIGNYSAEPRHMLSGWQLRYEPNPENLAEVKQNKMYFRLIFIDKRKK